MYVCVVKGKRGRNIKGILKTVKMSALEDNLQMQATDVFKSSSNYIAKTKKT